MDDPADRHGLSHMTAQMLLRGTPKRSRDAFEEAADQLGASIGVGSGREHTDFNITCLAEDLAECLALVGDAISNATFDHEQIELTRRESVAAIRQAEDKTMAMADHAVRELLFPPHHPRRHRTVGDDQGLAAIVREDLVSFHESRLARSPMTVAVVGGFESTEKMAGLVKSIFGDARRNGGERDPFDAAFPGSLQRASVVVPGKEQADVAIAYPVGGVGATGYYDFKMANAVLGEYGLMGKIGESVRQKQGLAYYAFSTILPGKSQSLWFSRAGVDPANVDRAIESIVAVIEEAMTSGLSARTGWHPSVAHRPTSAADANKCRNCRITARDQGVRSGPGICGHVPGFAGRSHSRASAICPNHIDRSGSHSDRHRRFRLSSPEVSGRQIANGMGLKRADGVFSSA